MMRLTPLPAFQDNYLWFLHDGRRALAVDPGDAQPVMAALQCERLELEAILVMHHHADHAGVAGEVRNTTGAEVHRPARARIAEPLNKSASLSGETRVCGTHEYTLSNLKSARSVEPGNLQLINYEERGKELRAGLPTAGQSRPAHPRSDVVQAARGHDAATAPDGVGVFATLRHWKNGFR